VSTGNQDPSDKNAFTNLNIYKNNTQNPELKLEVDDGILNSFQDFT
jgi:hypothetical protein